MQAASGRQAHLGGEGHEVLKSLLVLRLDTLATVHHFKVCKSVFGSDMCDAEIVSGLLLVMRVNRVVEAYSLEEVLFLALALLTLLFFSLSSSSSPPLPLLSSSFLFK